MSDLTFGCSHYKRKCKLIAPCCDTAYNCRFCHDEAVTNHTLDRQKVREIECLLCFTRQTVSNECIDQNCRTKFGDKYFCGICKLYDDVDKGQFHCDGCGICRAGGRDNFTHCNTCGLCLPANRQHKCIANTSHNNCPVCMEDIHTSRLKAHIPPCSHLLHYECFKDMMKEGLYACPTCGKSMQDMTSVWDKVDREVAETPMPAEYAGLYRKILCKDCNKHCYAEFHIVGMKCKECGSYNTTPDKGPLLRLEPGAGEGEDRVFTPLTDDQVEALSNIPIPIQETGTDDTPIPSDVEDGSEDGWETDDEVADEMVEEDLD